MYLKNSKKEKTKSKRVFIGRGDERKEDTFLFVQMAFQCKCEEEKSHIDVVYIDGGLWKAIRV